MQKFSKEIAAGGRFRKFTSENTPAKEGSEHRVRNRIN
jgi:hypothetical protein